MKSDSGENLYPNCLDKSSTSEHLTGRWIDNKLVYEKTIYFTTSNDCNLYVNHGLSSIADKYWINMEKSFVFGNNESLPVVWYYSASDWARAWLNSTDIRFRSPASLGSRTVYITIQYTKR